MTVGRRLRCLPIGPTRTVKHTQRCVVFGDRDHATLHEIQNQFLLDEPGIRAGLRRAAVPSHRLRRAPPADHTDRAAPGSADSSNDVTGFAAPTGWPRIP